MPNEVTKATVLPKDVSVIGSVAEEEALRLQQQMAEQYGLSLSPICDMDGNVVLVDGNGEHVVEIFSDGSSVVCSGYPCSDEEECSSKDISEMTAEELAEYILQLREAVASEETAATTQHSAAPFADSANIYTDELLSEPAVDTESRIVSEPTLAEQHEKTEPAGNDAKSTEAPVVPDAEHAGSAPLRSTEPEGAILASGAIAAGAIKIEISTESAFPVVERARRVETSARSSAVPHGATDVRGRSAVTSRSAGENNVPEIVVAGAEKLVSVPEGIRHLASENGVGSTVHDSMVMKETEREEEKGRVASARKAAGERRMHAQEDGASETEHSVGSRTARPRHRLTSDPFAAGSHAMVDSNSDPFAIASAAANKGAPPYYHLSSGIGVATVALGDAQDQSRVAPAQHRGDQGSRHGHDGEEGGRGKGQGGRDEDAESEDEGSVSSVA